MYLSLKHQSQVSCTVSVTSCPLKSHSRKLNGYSTWRAKKLLWHVYNSLTSFAWFQLILACETRHHHSYASHMVQNFAVQKYFIMKLPRCNSIICSKTKFLLYWYKTLGLGFNCTDYWNYGNVFSMFISNIHSLFVFLPSKEIK